MTDSKCGKQTIGCEVTSCRYNRQGAECELSRIEVMPCHGCNDGSAENESLCGSYRAK